MKKLNFIVCFLVCLSLFFCSSISAFAYGDTGINFQRIAELQDITWKDNYFIACDGTNYYIYLSNDDSDFTGFCRHNSVNGPDGQAISVDTALTYYVPVSNPYQDWQLVSGVQSGNLYNGALYFNTTFYDSVYGELTAEWYDDLTFMANTMVIYNYDSSVYSESKNLQRMESSPNLHPIVQANLLQGVLQEVVGLLPLLIPVLVTFIALRKGLKFLFSLLRMA